MPSPAEYRAYAATARQMGAEYRIEAVTEKEPRRSWLLKQADQRDEHADFWESRAEINEDFEHRHARQEIAA
jgi:hypothetical protein